MALFRDSTLQVPSVLKMMKIPRYMQYLGTIFLLNRLSKKTTTGAEPEADFIFRNTCLKLFSIHAMKLHNRKKNIHAIKQLGKTKLKNLQKAAK